MKIRKYFLIFINYILLKIFKGLYEKFVKTAKNTKQEPNANKIN